MFWEAGTAEHDDRNRVAVIAEYYRVGRVNQAAENV